MQVKSEAVVRVWRIEDKSCYGPYNMSGSEVENVTKHHNHTNGHPAPKYDKGIMRDIQESELCGFLNLEQVYVWFTKEELDRLRDEGFYLKRVRAKRITAIGEKQILFERR